MFLYILVKMALLDYLWIAENRFGMKKKKKEDNFQNLIVLTIRLLT